MIDGYDGVLCVVVYCDFGVWYGDEDGGKFDFVVMYGGFYFDEMLILFVMVMIDLFC